MSACEGQAGESERPARGGSGGADDDVAPCSGNDSSAGAICVERVRGRVVDEEGEPVPDLPVTVCGSVCYRGVTDNAGVFAVEIGDFILVSEYSVQAHGSPHRSTFYHPMPETLPTGEAEVGDLKVVDLPTDGDLLLSKLDLDGDVSPAQSVTSGEVSLSIAEGTVVRLSVADSLADEEGRRFRARSLDEQLFAEFVPGADFSRIYALGPFEAAFKGPSPDDQVEVSLTIENVDDFAPGQEVPVFALGTYLDSEWLTPGAFEEIGISVVSEDGSELVLSSAGPGQGLRHLTWLAVGYP